MSLKDAVLEIGCEEIPSSYIRPAIDQMVAAATASLKDHRIHFQEMVPYYTPRRLALYFKGLPEMQEDVVQEVSGPPVSVAFDAHGLPTRAGEGFAKAQGVAVPSLKRKTTPKGEVVVAIKKVSGRLTSEILYEVFPEIIKKIRFPKVQRWGDGDFLFARPIRWILAVFSHTIIPFEIAGLRADRLTYGLRALKMGPLDVDEAGFYLDALKRGGVWADPKERLEKIRSLVVGAARDSGAQLIEDEDLLKDVNNLIESPDVIRGSFDPKYLELPSSVIVTAMREHQKYFAMKDGKGGLVPGFIGVINGVPRDYRAILQSNEAVLRARLEDAKFFVAEDMKTTLEAWAEKLSGITWLEGMGNLTDKAARIQKLAKQLGALAGFKNIRDLEQAALLAKADLVTNIIREKEFNSLQGVMGAVYAEKQGKSRDLADAIREHYQPRWAGDQLPQSEGGALLSLADKMDTIAGCFKARLIPTGSQDPFALRRQALGVLQILIARKFPFSIGDLVSKAQAQYKGKAAPKERQEVVDFLKGRLQNVLESRNIPYDVVNAVIATEAPTLIDLIDKAETVSRAKGEGDFQELATAAGRVLRILPEKPVRGKVAGALLKQHEEKALHHAVDGLRKRLEKALAERDYGQVRVLLQELVGPIHAFFEKILVMDKNAKVRNNRLALLRDTSEVLLSLCDFRKLVYASDAPKN